MTDYNLWLNDLTNRFPLYTFTETVVGGGYKVVATVTSGGASINNGTVKFSSSQWDLYKRLRENLLDGDADIVPKSTTAQAAALSGIVDGTKILNITKGKMEICNDSEFVTESNEIGITASTTQTQSGATQLTSIMNFVETVANTDDSVKLSTVANGDEISVINNGANTLQIYPFTSDDLGNGTNIPMELEPNEEITFWGKNSTTWHVLHNSESFHGSMYEQDNTTAFVIHETDVVHAYHSAGLVGGDLGEWTFNAGSAGASVTISSIADNSGGTILVTTGSAHGGTVDDIACHTALTDSNYAGFFKILTVPSTTTYSVTATYTATGTGFTDRPAYLTPNDIATGFYNLEWVSTMAISGSGVTLEFHLHDGVSIITGSKSGYKFASTPNIKQPNGLGEKIISSGDRIFFAIINQKDATNITLEHFKMRLEHI